MIAVRLAEQTFRLRCRYDYTPALCREYLVPDDKHAPEISVTEQEIQRENIGGNFPEGYLEGLAIFRKIADFLLEKEVVLFHSSVVSVNGEGYAFTALSGTGKSTHTRLWREMLGSRAVMINDDKPFISLAGDRPVVYGTPWNGKHGLGCNRSVPLKAICLLHRGEENRISRISPKEAYPTLFGQSFRPDDPAKIPRLLRLTGKLSEAVALYSMHCTISLEAAKMAYDMMKCGD